jgi:hypothetical protein
MMLAATSFRNAVLKTALPHESAPASSFARPGGALSRHRQGQWTLRMLPRIWSNPMDQRAKMEQTAAKQNLGPIYFGLPGMIESLERPHGSA